MNFDLLRKNIIDAISQDPVTTANVIVGGGILLLAVCMGTYIAYLERRRITECGRDIKHRCIILSIQTATKAIGVYASLLRRYRKAKYKLAYLTGHILQGVPEHDKKGLNSLQLIGVQMVSIVHRVRGVLRVTINRRREIKKYGLEGARERARERWAQADARIAEGFAARKAYQLSQQ